MAYLNLDLDYFDHPQTLKLIDLLGRGAEVLPIRLWAYCGRFYPETGRLAGYSAQKIEHKLCWWGSKGKCVHALAKAGYLGKDAQGYFAENWLKHQGHIFALKVRAKKMADARWAKIKDATSNAVSNAVSHAYSNAPSVPSLPSIPSSPPTPPRGATGWDARTQQHPVNCGICGGGEHLVEGRMHRKDCKEAKWAVEEGWIK